MSRYIELLVITGNSHKSVYFGPFVGQRDEDEFVDKLRVGLVRMPQFTLKFAILSVDEVPKGEKVMSPNGVTIGFVFELIPILNN